MKLFYKTGACSLASRIALIETGLSFTAEEVDTDTGLSKSGLNYKQINPKGYVPALELENGEVLTEGASVLQFIASQAPDQQLVPTNDPIGQARLQEYLNYTSSELHKAFSPLFSDNSTASEQEKAKQNVAQKFDYLENLLSDNRTFLVNNTFSVADAYLFVVLNWSNFVGIDLSSWKNISTYFQGIFNRKSVQQALIAEGLTS
ncbi:glutathione transferase GstA [Curvivirga sp.]|uniref:glutathione transferase GstA n=1 Tax=Curvivirga sp. TaxID=2856848 RepID=UPI003B5ABF7A